MQSSSPTSPPPAPQKRKRPLWLKLVLALVGLMFAGVACAGLVLGYALVVATPVYKAFHVGLVDLIEPKTLSFPA